MFQGGHCGRVDVPGLPHRGHGGVAGAAAGQGGEELPHRGLARHRDHRREDLPVQVSDGVKAQ